jgi:TIR domain-containing protein
MPGIFICYRRDDSSAYAGRLYDRLLSHFGSGRVFMDVDNIEPGLDFVEVLERTVSSCDALIAVMGKHWLGATDEEGRRRLDDAEDLVRLEIAAALTRKVRVVPVLVGGARMPRGQDLPDDIAPLSRRNALEVSDLAFHQSVGRLIEVLDKILKDAAEVPPSVIAGKRAEPPQIVVQPQPARSVSIQDKAKDEPSATLVPPMHARQSSYSGVPRWRRRLLLYLPRGFLGFVMLSWILRFWCLFTAFTFCVGLAVGINEHGAFGEGSFYGLEFGFGTATLLLRFVASWSDRRAARKLVAGT